MQCLNELLFYINEYYDLHQAEKYNILDKECNLSI